MEKEQLFTKEELWDSAINSAKLTLTFLSRLQDEKHPAIQDALPVLKALVDLPPYADIPVEISNQLNANQSHKNQRSQDPNWLIVSPKEVKVKLGADPNNVIIARTVTNEKELDILIKKMYSSEVIALDCEFMTAKNKPPSLKVLQVAISKSEGYAIIFDKLEPDLIQTKLRPVLEDSSLNFVGWAFNGDALAIKAAIRGIEIAPVLDLQSKLRPIAIEKMNLFSGITKFAPDWEGLEEFQKAKALGDSFIYFEGGCIWLKDPLPPSALVYAIFDVVSLIVLAESTAKHPTKRTHFWPCNLEDETPKAQRRYNNQLANITASPQHKPQSSPASLTSQSQQFERNQSVSPQFSNKSIDDKSVPKSPSITHNQNGSPSIKNISQQNTNSYSSQYNENKNIIRNEGQIYFSPVIKHTGRTTTTTTTTSSSSSSSPSTKSTPVTNSRQANPWGEFSKQEHSTYLDKSASPKSSTLTPPVKNASLPPRSSLRSPVSLHQNIPNSQPSPKRSEKVLASPSKSTTTTNEVFSSKPDTFKSTDDMRNMGGMITDQKVTFTNEENVPGGPEISVWKNFAESTVQQWRKNNDVAIEAFEEMKSNASPRPQTSNTQSSTPASNNKISEWDKEDDRPEYMQIELNHVPYRRDFSGPKVTNPNVSDESDDDDDDNDDDGIYNNMKPKFTTKTSEYLNIEKNDAAASQWKSDSSQPNSYENKWQGNARSPQSSYQSPQLNNLNQPQTNDVASLSSDSPLFSNEAFCSHDSAQDTDVEDLEIFQDTLYLYSGETLKLCKISAPNELNLIKFPSITEPFTVAITYHYVVTNTNNRGRLKGLQFYFENGDCFVVVVSQACFNSDMTIKSKVATLLTHPKIKRICWNPELAFNDIKQTMSVALGPTVDVCKKANAIGQPHGQTFVSNLEFYLKDWPALEQFISEKEKYDKGVRKSFSNLWDREKLPMNIIEYSALEAAALYTLHQHPDLKAASDEPYLLVDH